MAELEGRRALLVNAHPMTEEIQSGVKEVLLRQADILGQLGMAVTTVGPNMFGSDRLTGIWGLREVDRNLAMRKMGLSFNFGGNLLETAGHLTFSFNTPLARTIMRQVRPDVTIFHQPAVNASVVHTLLSAANDYNPNMACVYWLHSVYSAEPFLARRYRDLALWIGQNVMRKVDWNERELTPGWANTLIHCPDETVAVSNAAKLSWIGNYQLPADRIIYNPVDADLMSPYNPDLHRPTELKEGDFNVLAPFRFDLRKGGEYLLRAFRIVRGRIPNARLIMIGKGTEENNLKTLASDLKLWSEGDPDSPVQFLAPFKDKKDIASYFVYTDVVAAPSVNGEAFNNTIAEALAAGVIVVASGIDGQREAAGGGDKIFAPLVPPRDPEALAQALIAVAQRSRDQNKAIGLRGREYSVDNFSYDAHGRLTQDLLLDVFDGVEAHGPQRFRNGFLAPKPLSWSEMALIKKLESLGDLWREFH